MSKAIQKVYRGLICLHNNNGDGENIPLSGMNGHLKDDNKLHINLLSSDDGRLDIVNAAKYLCKASECDSVNVQQIMPKHFSAYLTGKLFYYVSHPIKNINRCY